MEIQSTNKIATNKIVCRKCGGPHFTIKCGKEAIEEKKDTTETEKKNTTETEKKDYKSNNNQDYKSNNNRDYKSNNNHDYKSNNNHDNHDYKNNNNRDYKNNTFERRERKQYFKTTYRVKLADLPTDMTEEEMMELTSEWGHIVRIRVLNYNESSVAYIDFGYEEEADYFVKAIDKTPFGMILISSTRVESYNPT